MPSTATASAPNAFLSPLAVGGPQMVPMLPASVGPAREEHDDGAAASVGEFGCGGADTAVLPDFNKRTRCGQREEEKMGKGLYSKGEIGKAGFGMEGKDKG